MSYIDSDLEEGEIPDDSPSSPHITVKKDRELPRRYILRENKSIHKHKKDCKYAIRYHAKKLAKLKKTPTRDAYKKHRKSCPHDKSHKCHIKYDSPVSEHLLENNHSFSKHSLIAEINCSFKDLLIKKQNLNPSRSSPQKYFSEIRNKATNSILSVSENSENSESQLKSRSDSLCESKQCEHYVKKKDVPCLKKLDTSNKIKDTTVSHYYPVPESESEDEEELRRIALATCAKRKPVVEPSENLNLSTDTNCIVSVRESQKANVQVLPKITNNLVSDNYEVVDMEVDEDTENSFEVVDNESLFVIDTKPSSKLEGNIENSVSVKQHEGNSSDDDFEADILRAELIGSMFRKRAVLEEQLEEQQPSAVIYPKQVPVAQEKISAVYQKPNVNLHHKSLQPTKRILRKNGVNKCVKLKRSSSRLARSNQVNRYPKRLIINLDAESSSEESGDTAEVNPVPENPVASIEALISDCRQKSDSNEKMNEAVKHVPEALSCLSKAQQEEYSSLLKILAEKEKLPASQETFHYNNGTVHSPLDDLKLLEEKLLRFKETLKKKKLLMTNISKDVNVKKQMYMNSKASAQNLKEQYVAAEKVRRRKLDEWSKSCRNFEFVKKSVSNLESQIIQLQNVFSKLGSSVQGQTYNLFSLPRDNGQL